MNIQAEGYTEEQLTAALLSSTRQVRYKYIAFKSTGECLGEVEIQNGRISYDSTTEVMRTFTGTMKENDVINSECVDYQIMPYMCLMMFNNKEANFPLGRFIINATRELESNISMLNITGYDLGKIALDDKSSTRFLASSANSYKYSLELLLQSIYTNIEITSYNTNKSFSQEWEIGTPKIEIANDLLKGMNYNPLYFDAEGVGHCTPYTLPSEKAIDFQYVANKTSVIIDGMTLESDKFNIPNKWIRYTENPESSYLISVYVNDDDNSPYSVQNRGRYIVDSSVVNDIADQATLNAYTKRIASNAMQETFTLNFSTLNMPGHEYRENLWVEVSEYGIADRFIEIAWEMELEPGGRMTHVCKKVVVL